MASWFGAPSETDVQAKMAKIEQARQSGSFLDPSEMDAAGQEALKRLMKGGQVQPGQPIQQPPQGAPQGGQAPPPPQGQPAPMPPQMAGVPPQGTAPGQANVTPPQGGVWGDAEKMQRNRALAGLPGVQ